MHSSEHIKRCEVSTGNNLGTEIFVPQAGDLGLTKESKI